MSTTTKAFVISREFDAPRDLVFKAWTEKDRLGQWWSPKGMQVTVCKLDLRVGGMFHYKLVVPDSPEFFGRFIYREITPPEKLVYVNSFADADGNISRNVFNDVWPLELLSTITFEESNGRTKLTVEWMPINETPEESKSFEDGHESMTAGWGGTLDNLEAYLTKSR